MDVFNIHIEFDSQVFRDTVEQHIKEKKKAYVVDANEGATGTGQWHEKTSVM